MTLENYIQTKIELEIFGEAKEISFTLRNFAAIKCVFGVSEISLVQGLFDGDVEKIIAAIWGSTLVFEDFDPKDPVKIKSQLSIEKLYSLTLSQVKEINEKLIQAIISSMPKENNEEIEEEKKTQTNPEN